MINLTIAGENIFIKFKQFYDFFDEDIYQVFKLLKEYMIRWVSVSDEAIYSTISIREENLSDFITRLKDKISEKPFYFDPESSSLYYKVFITLEECDTDLVPLSYLLKDLPKAEVTIKNCNFDKIECNLDCDFLIQDSDIDFFSILNYYVNMDIRYSNIGLLSIPFTLVDSELKNKQYLTKAKIDVSNYLKACNADNFRADNTSTASIHTKASDICISIPDTDLYIRVTSAKDKHYIGADCTLFANEYLIPKGYMETPFLLSNWYNELHKTHLMYLINNNKESPYNKLFLTSKK